MWQTAPISTSRRWYLADQIVESEEPHTCLTNVEPGEIDVGAQSTLAVNAKRANPMLMK